jgi:hypothetical protein
MGNLQDRFGRVLFGGGVAGYEQDDDHHEMHDGGADGCGAPAEVLVGSAEEPLFRLNEEVKFRFRNRRGGSGVC